MGEKEKLEEIKQILQDACDRDWEDESLYATASIAANGLYWRGKEIERLKAELNIAKDGLAVSADIIRQYQAPRAEVERIQGKLIIKGGEINDSLPPFGDLPDGEYELWRDMNNGEGKKP